MHFLTSQQTHKHMYVSFKTNAFTTVIKHSETTTLPYMACQRFR